MASVPPLDEIIETFELLGDWEERFNYLLDLGRMLPGLPEAERTEEARVHGCQAQVWLRLETAGDPPRVRMRAVSDAHIVNGLIAILTAIYDDRPLASVCSSDAEAVFRRLDLDSHLSGTRRNGLAAMITRIRALAASLETPS